MLTTIVPLDKTGSTVLRSHFRFPSQLSRGLPERVGFWVTQLQVFWEKIIVAPLPLRVNTDGGYPATPVDKEKADCIG
jgi:hypothetical protein